MKKTAIISLSVLVVVLLGLVGYLLLSPKNIVVKSIDPSPTKSVELTASRPLDLSALIAKLKADYPTVTDSYIYTEAQDPNNNLGKAGYYTAGAEFYDTRTNTEPDGTAFGADSGGAIEVYASTGDATKRADYLKQFQGSGALDPGAYKQIQNVVVRVSSAYKASEQTEMIGYLVGQIDNLTK